LNTVIELNSELGGIARVGLDTSDTRHRQLIDLRVEYHTFIHHPTVVAAHTVHHRNNPFSGIAIRMYRSYQLASWHLNPIGYDPSRLRSVVAPRVSLSLPLLIIGETRLDLPSLCG
jgi:hypothetical protein